MTMQSYWLEQVASQGGNGAGDTSWKQLPSPPRSPNPIPRPSPDMLDEGKYIPGPDPMTDP